MIPEKHGNIWLTTVAPIMGVVLATAMYASPMKVVFGVLARKELGNLNAIPMGFIVANCAAWIAYSYVTEDLYVFLANQPGLMMGLFMSISCIFYAEQKIRYILQGMIVGSATVMGILGFITVKLTAAVCTQSDGVCKPARLLWGYAANVILFFYYGAPLSVVGTVVKTRNSAFLYWPLSVASLLNATLWVGYGAAVNDAFIWLPNLVGMLFAIIQLILICIYPRKAISEPKELGRESSTDRLLDSEA